MDADSKKKYLHWVGYSVVFFCVLLFFIYQMFPYELLVKRLTNRVQRRARMQIDIDRVSPYWLTGLQAKNVTVQTRVKKGIAELQVDQVQARLSILSLLVGTIEAAFKIHLAQGKIEGLVAKKGPSIVGNVNISDLQLAALGPTRQRLRINKQAKPLLSMLFAPIYGRLHVKLNAEVPLPGTTPVKRKVKKRTKKRKGRKRRVYRRPRGGFDIRRVTGKVKVNIHGLSIGPGYFPTAKLGELPVPLLRLGSFMLKLKVEKGRVQIIKCVAIGQDGELHVTGHIQLRSKLNYSIFKGKIKFKIKPAFLQNPSTSSLLKAALRALGPGKNGGYHTYSVYAPFRGTPRFRKQ